MVVWVTSSISNFRYSLPPWKMRSRLWVHANPLPLTICGFALTTALSHRPFCITTVMICEAGLVTRTCP